MNWKLYREGQGPHAGEVLIFCDPADLDHPWLTQRISEYRQDGKAVFVNGRRAEGITGPTGFTGTTKGLA